MTDDDNRLAFDAAVQFVQQHPGQAAFAAMPVFGDREDAAEGARVFVIEADAVNGYQVRFVAGPFFSTAFAANETLAPGEVPDRVREMRFMPTRLESGWLDEQVQILIQKLVQASGLAAPQMPDYASAPVVGSKPGTEFPISFVGRREGD